VGHLAYGLHVQFAERAASRVGNESRIRIDLANLGIPQTPQIEQALLMPQNISAPGGIMRVGRSRQLVTGGRFESLPAMLAKALATAGPAIAEDAIHSIGADDLLVDL